MVPEALKYCSDYKDSRGSGRWRQRAKTPTFGPSIGPNLNEVTRLMVRVRVGVLEASRFVSLPFIHGTFQVEIVRCEDIIWISKHVHQFESS